MVISMMGDGSPSSAVPTLSSYIAEFSPPVSGLLCLTDPTHFHTYPKHRILYRRASVALLNSGGCLLSGHCRMHVNSEAQLCFALYTWVADPFRQRRTLCTWRHWSTAATSLSIRVQCSSHCGPVGCATWHGDGTQSLSCHRVVSALLIPTSSVSFQLEHRITASVGLMHSLASCGPWVLEDCFRTPDYLSWDTIEDRR